MDRPITTLFMLMSVDGKISTGSTDELDVDRDFPKIDGKSLTTNNELSGLGVLKLEDCSVLEESYIRLRYKVIS